MSEENSAGQFIPPQWLESVYQQIADQMMRPNPLVDEWRKERQEWWDSQTRWFKMRYKARSWLRKHRDNLRYKIANAIYPYPEDCNY